MTLSAAANYVESQFGKKRPHRSTMSRWCVRGCLGRRLESIKVGGQRQTSREAIDRFFKSDPFVE